MTKTAIITGASRGIGRMTALLLAEKGLYDNFIITCRKNIDALNSVTEEMKKCSVSVTVFKGDAGDEAFSGQLSEYIAKAGLTPSLLINNAGVSYTGLIQDMTFTDWKHIMNTDLDSLFLMSKLVIPYMIREGSGRIINISSVWGERGASCEVAYSAAKGAVNSFTKALAKELAPSGIAVNAVAPGFVDTDMNSHLTAEDIEALREEIPADRITTPEEVAKVIALLAESPVYMTGQIISVDGAWQV